MPAEGVAKWSYLIETLTIFEFSPQKYPQKYPQQAIRAPTQISHLPTSLTPAWIPLNLMTQARRPPTVTVDYLFLGPFSSAPYRISPKPILPHSARAPIIL